MTRLCCCTCIASRFCYAALTIAAPSARVFTASVRLPPRPPRLSTYLLSTSRICGYSWQLVSEAAISQRAGGPGSGPSVQGRRASRFSTCRARALAVIGVQVRPRPQLARNHAFCTLGSKEGRQPSAANAQHVRPAEFDHSARLTAEAHGASRGLLAHTATHAHPHRLFAA